MEKRNYLILLIVILFVSCVTYDRPIAPEEIRTFEKIIEIPNTTKDELYIKANEWFVNTFNSAESVIQFQDKEAGKIMGKYKFRIVVGHPVSLNAGMKSTISVDVKDNRAKIFIQGLTSDFGADLTNDLEFVKEARKVWNKMALSLEKSLNKEVEW